MSDHRNLAFVLAFIWAQCFTMAPLHSQSCGVIQNCNPNHQYPYHFCDGNGNVSRECSADPAGVTPPKMVFRLPLPACAKLELNGDAPPGQTTMRDVNGNAVVVNDPTEWEDIVNQSIDPWNCLCGTFPPNSQQSQCCIRVAWTRNEQDFQGSAANGIALCWRLWMNSTCTPPCFGGQLFLQDGMPVVYINNTDLFTARNLAGGGEVLRFTYTGASVPTGPNGAALDRRYQAYSLRHALLHEMGHWFGLEHPDEPPACYPQGQVDGVMHSVMQPNVPPKALTMQDKCQFMKLYCSTLTSIPWNDIREQQLTQEKFAVSKASGQVSILHFDCDRAAVDAHSIDGRYLGSLPCHLEPATRKLNIDISGLSYGTVVLTFVCGDRDEIMRKLFVLY